MSEGQLPLSYDHRPTGRGDDYLDLTGMPLFPFGHGLSYTTFAYTDLTISPDHASADDTITVSCRVTNTGTRIGDEVVQLYVKDVLASLARPVMSLKGFSRVQLGPGETKTVRFTIGRDALRMLDASMRWVVDQAIETPVSLIGIVWMALLAYTIFTITTVLQRKEIARGLALGLASLTVVAAPFLLLYAGWPLIVVSDEPERATRSDMNFLWTTFTRFEPAADIHAAGHTVTRNHLSYKGPIAIDARMKPGYPDELHCREDVASTVTRRWAEYFPSRKVEMGDSDRAHLD
mgnify:CR=1 FL=1